MNQASKLTVLVLIGLFSLGCSGGNKPNPAHEAMKDSIRQAQETADKALQAAEEAKMAVKQHHPE